VHRDAVDRHVVPVTAGKLDSIRRERAGGVRRCNRRSAGDDEQGKYAAGGAQAGMGTTKASGLHCRPGEWKE
jgi:hypothetical protein